MTPVAVAIVLARAAGDGGPSAKAVEALLPTIDGGCLVGKVRSTGRWFDACIALEPHVAQVACRSAAESVDGYECHYKVRYMDDHGMGFGYVQERTDLFKPAPGSEAGWELVREIVAPKNS